MPDSLVHYRDIFYLCCQNIVFDIRDVFDAFDNEAGERMDERMNPVLNEILALKRQVRPPMVGIFRQHRHDRLPEIFRDDHFH